MYVYVYVCVCVSARACACACVHARARVCVRARTHTRAHLVPEVLQPRFGALKSMLLHDLLSTRPISMYLPDHIFMRLLPLCIFPNTLTSL